VAVGELWPQHDMHCPRPDIAIHVENFTPSNRRQRTGFTVGVVFLELNGFEIRASEEDVIQAIFAVAAGDLDEGGYAAWLGANTKRTRNR
jgi:death-on-curing protein